MLSTTAKPLFVNLPCRIRRRDHPLQATPSSLYSPCNLNVIHNSTAFLCCQTAMQDQAQGPPLTSHSQQPLRPLKPQRYPQQHGISLLSNCHAGSGAGTTLYKPLPAASAASITSKSSTSAKYFLLMRHVGLGAGSGTGITSYKPLPAASAASATPGGLQEQLAVAHRGLALVLPHVAAASVQAQFSRADASVVLAAALLEVSAAHVLPHSGCNLHSALAVFKNTAVAGTEPAARKACRNHEWLQAKLCHLVVKETASPEPAMTPAQVREFVLQALSMYPRNLSLLQLLEVLESRAHAYVRLQQFMRTAVDAHPSTHLLAHALTSEVQRQRCSSIVSLGGGESVWLGGRPPAVRLRPLLERAAATQQLATSPQLWLMYLRYEVQQGQPDAVRRVFLRGVRQCPGCKALWLEGLLYAAATPSPALSAGGTAAGAPSTAGLLPPRQAAELLEVMGDKGVRVRTDVMEAVMQALDEQPLLL
ncbi:hypothetical protein DUNSADRAFT_15875 [Dunaliella salina]|uniref:Uncharacterized protein n=1 Tax=Dunaliella salina TaxID=3046 RepID=A0ABQ7G4P1_DUNSA|nr:hypothetical protein DUNSADRAFT_15875 [Dunaliella salina]|eukprot:KAF5829576.1 hypothetical protein DUNSADRAFT_15875 [Dunaliella salina]